MAKTGSWQVQGSPWAHSGLEDRGGGACQEATAKSGFFFILIAENTLFQSKKLSSFTDYFMPPPG